MITEIPYPPPETRIVLSSLAGALLTKLIKLVMIEAKVRFLGASGVTQ
jgi:hypothetical protein